MVAETCASAHDPAAAIASGSQTGEIFIPLVYVNPWSAAKFRSRGRGGARAPGRGGLH
jgi:hypothetical protein